MPMYMLICRCLCRRRDECNGANFHAKNHQQNRKQADTTSRVEHCIFSSHSLSLLLYSFFVIVYCFFVFNFIETAYTASSNSNCKSSSRNCDCSLKHIETSATAASYYYFCYYCMSFCCWRINVKQKNRWLYFMLLFCSFSRWRWCEHTMCFTVPMCSVVYMRVQHYDF